MLYCKATCIPPYFGTLQECKKAQKIFELKLNEEYKRMSKSKQREIIDILNN